MKRIIFLLGLLLFFAFSYLYLIQDFSKTKSNLIYNGIILTMEAVHPSVEAIFVEDGIIQAVGKYDELKDLADEDTEVLDLDGNTLMPGFIDSHTHAVGSSFLHSMIDLSGFKHNRPEEVWTHLESEVKNFDKGEWIVCKGLDPVLVKGLIPPHISYLDSIAPDNPLFIISQSLHSQWANSLAFQEVGIDENSPDPSASSYYEKDEAGKLTGFIAEQEAFYPFRLKLVEAGREQLVKSIVQVMDQYAAYGNTTIATLGMSTNDPNAFRLYEHLSSEKPGLLNQVLVKFGMLPERKAGVRHFAYIRKDAINLLPSSPENGDDFFKVLGVKFWYDGSPYTGSMYVEEPYLVSPLTKEGFLIPDGWRGEALIEHDSLEHWVKKYQSEGWQIAIHAQGDLAIREILEVLEKNPAGKDKRTRLEHCILLAESSIPKMKELGITPNFHINHLYYYGQALRDEIIGPERAEKLLPIKTAANAGLAYAMHADKPMFESDPISLMSTAIQRQTRQGDTLGFDQALSIEESLRAMTINAAWQLQMEDKIGSIKAGKYADFVVLDQNPLQTSPENFRDISILQTIVNGNTVYKNE
ncbi:MAG: amidohydrolase [Bacteroidia bacterium]|nr:amidohydrolase [Bacteroidia bacterium]